VVAINIKVTDMNLGFHETKTIKWYYLLLPLPKGPAFDKM
jgi:hypothetical protein